MLDIFKKKDKSLSESGLSSSNSTLDLPPIPEPQASPEGLSQTDSLNKVQPLKHPKNDSISLDTNSLSQDMTTTPSAVVTDQPQKPILKPITPPVSSPEPVAPTPEPTTDLPSFKELPAANLNQPSDNNSVQVSSPEQKPVAEQKPVEEHVDDISFDDLPDFTGGSPPITQASSSKEEFVATDESSVPKVISPDLDDLLFEELYVQRSRYIDLLKSVEDVRMVIGKYKQGQKDIFPTEKKLNNKLQRMNTLVNQMNKKLMAIDDSLVKSKG